MSELGLEAIVRISLLGVLLLAAAATDLRWRCIPNELTWGGALAGALCQTWIAGVEGLAHALYGWVAGALVFLPGFLLRFTGAGDVKLMAATGAFLGPAGALLAGAASIVSGAALAFASILLGSWRQRLGSPGKRYALMWQGWLETGRPSYIPAAETEVMGKRIPQGVAIALGTSGMLMFPIWQLCSGA